MPAAITYAQRHPTVSPTAGTARPASSVASGTQACLTPNDSPRRRAGIARASVRFVLSWPMTLVHAPSSTIATTAA